MAVVADDQYRPLIICEVALQPIQRCDVQVMGRFIEQQQRRRGQQQAGQGGARLLPAGELGEGAIFVGRRKAQPTQHAPDFMFVLVAAGRFKGDAGRFVALQEVCVRRVILAHFSLQVAQFTLPAAQFGKGAQLLLIEAVLPLVRADFLGQIADLQLARPLNLPDDGLIFTAEDAQQAGFASAIGADQGDARILRDGAIHFLEDDLAALTLGQAARLQQGHRWNATEAQGRGVGRGPWIRGKQLSPRPSLRLNALQSTVKIKLKGLRYRSRLMVCHARQT